MSLTITLVTNAPATITYGALGWTMASHVGRYAVDIDQGTGLDDVRRMRPTGVDGNLVIRCGEMTNNIKMLVRYVGDTINYAEAAYQSDMNALRGATGKCSIAYSGQTISGCNLVTNSVSRATRVRNTGYPVSGSLTQVFFDVAMLFVKDDYGV